MHFCTVALSFRRTQIKVKAVKVLIYLIFLSRVTYIHSQVSLRCVLPEEIAAGFITKSFCPQGASSKRFQNVRIVEVCFSCALKYDLISSQKRKLRQEYKEWTNGANTPFNRG